MTRNEATQELLKLAAEYPELPILPQVDGELCTGEYGWYLGDFGKPEVGEYALYKERFYSERSDFAEAYYEYNDEALCAKFGYDPRISIFAWKNGHCTTQQYEENMQKEDKLTLYLNEVAERAFRKAILVPIYLPDEDGIFTEFEEEEK